MTRVALVQEPPCFLDRRATLERAVDCLERAARGGASLVVFPETYVPGYPDWVWRLRPLPENHLADEIQVRLLDSAVDLSRGDLDPLCEAARRLSLTVAVGVVERDGAYSRGTTYNTLVLISPNGEILNRHRKLVPTHPERMLWGMGDATGLRVVDTPAGRIGGLICWENYIPLARHTLYAQGVEIYLAPTWDQGEGWLGSMQHIAREGRCWVISCAICVQARDLPADLPGRAQIYPDQEEWLNSGDAVIIDPYGKIVAGPMRRERGILFGDCDPSQAAVARRTLDVAGHYSRPDIFRLIVRAEPLVQFELADRDK
jgi:nitrilase